MLGTDVSASRKRQARRKASWTASSASARLPRIRQAVRNEPAYPSSSQSSSRCSIIPLYDAARGDSVRRKENFLCGGGRVLRGCRRRGALGERPLRRGPGRRHRFGPAARGDDDTGSLGDGEGGLVTVAAAVCQGPVEE